MDGLQCLVTSEKLEGWDEIFVPPEELRDLKEMKRVWLVTSGSTKSGVLELRNTYNRPEKLIEYMTAVSKDLIYPDRGLFSICGIILNYDGSREPRQREYDRKVIWSFLKRWAAKKFPEKSLKEIYEALVTFDVNQGDGYYYLAPIGSMMHPASTTGLGWRSFYGNIYWYTYPNELENHANELTDVQIMGLTPEPVRVNSYDEFLVEIGMKEEC
jgi:hypothetical protein